MDSRKRGVVCVTFLAAAFCFAAPLPPAAACELAILWRADMTNQAKTSSAAAAIQFDFAHPGATVPTTPLNWHASAARPVAA